MKKLYVGGKMTGVQDHNFPAFDAAKRALSDYCWDVTTPADISRRAQKTGNADGTISDADLQALFRLDVEEVLRSDAIAFLPGWETSGGSRFELMLAQKIGIPIYQYDPSIPCLYTGCSFPIQRAEDRDIPPNPAIVHTSRPQVTSKNMLSTVDALVSDTRQKEYGHPADNFERMAALWSTITGANIEPDKVPLMLIAIKIARQISSHQDDNFLDIAGYAKTAMMAREKWDAESEF